MTSNETPELDADFDLEAPEVEGDGYFQDKTLQWVDLCPHMGTPEKSLLRTLTNLTTKRSRSRRLRPDELRQMVHTGPVKVGEGPKLISHSGLLRLLRNLATIGQITDRDGGMLRFSSRESARSRAITMTVWRYPRHECGCQRNVFDALDVIRGEDPKWKPAGIDKSAFHRPTQTGQEVDPGGSEGKAGHEVNPPGHEVNPPGHEVNPPEQLLDPHSQGDQEKPRSPSSPPSSPPSSSSSSHTGGANVTPTPREPAEEEEETSSTRGRSDAPSSAMALIREMTEATVEEAEALVEVLRPEAKRSLGGFIRTLAKNDDLPHRLWLLRRERASEARTQASAASRRWGVCSLHGIQGACPACRDDLHDGGALAQSVKDMFEALGPDRACLRPDLAQHPALAPAAT